MIMFKYIYICCWCYHTLSTCNALKRLIVMDKLYGVDLTFNPLKCALLIFWHADNNIKGVTRTIFGGNIGNINYNNHYICSYSDIWSCKFYINKVIIIWYIIWYVYIKSAAWNVRIRTNVMINYHNWYFQCFLQKSIHRNFKKSYQAASVWSYMVNWHH